MNHFKIIFSFKINNDCYCIAKISLTSPIVLNVPTRALLAGETKGSFVQWLANFNIKRNFISMFVNKHPPYC